MKSSVLCCSKLILKKEDVVPNFYEWKLNEPYDYMVSSFADLVTSCVDQLMDVNLRQKLTTGFLTPGLLASFILDMTETLITHQNWNSAGANVCMTICNIALLIAEARDVVISGIMCPTAHMQASLLEAVMAAVIMSM